MAVGEKSCACHRSKARFQKRKALPVVFGLAVALLPKCPFCVLAWSSAITLCSGEQIYDHSAGWTSWISVGLVALTLGLIVWNYRGARTLFAALAVLIGGVLVVRAELMTGSLPAYYTGSAFLLSGVWMNGSFLPLLRQWIAPMLRNRQPLTNKNS